MGWMHTHDCLLSFYCGWASCLCVCDKPVAGKRMALYLWSSHTLYTDIILCQGGQLSAQLLLCRVHDSNNIGSAATSATAVTAGCIEHKRKRDACQVLDNDSSFVWSITTRSNSCRRFEWWVSCDVISWVIDAWSTVTKWQRSMDWWSELCVDANNVCLLQMLMVTHTTANVESNQLSHTSCPCSNDEKCKCTMTSWEQQQQWQQHASINYCVQNCSAPFHISFSTNCRFTAHSLTRSLKISHPKKSKWCAR